MVHICRLSTVPFSLQSCKSVCYLLCLLAISFTLRSLKVQDTTRQRGELCLFLLLVYPIHYTISGISAWLLVSYLCAQLMLAEGQSEAAKRKELQAKIKQLRDEISHLDSQIRGTEEQMATQGLSFLWCMHIKEESM